MNPQGKLAILVGGGPAPGINSVIGAATIRSLLEGVPVLGIRDGFEWIMQGDIDHVTPLDIDDVSRIHFRGGSQIGISRANPTTDHHLLENAVLALLRLDVSQLITIGGDDTAFSAMKLLEEARGRLRIVHVPKTIDNDLDLPAYVDTFGFQTARHVGVDIVKNLMVDAKTTSRWYFVTAMGRKAGHLALGIGKSAGATLTLIPEEFSGRRIRLKTVVDTLAGAIIKRLSHDRRDGVAILAEGLVLSIDPADLAQVDEVEKDAHGHVRIDEVNISEILKAQVRARLKPFGLKATIVAKSIGYELRCADPIPSDMEYTRDLGYCAAKYLLSGGTGVMISMQAGNLVPIPFEKLVDPETGRTKVRMVDTHSTRYAIARRYMLRLRRDDFDDAHELAKFAATAGLSLDEFCREFQYLVEDEPPGLVVSLGEAEAGSRPPALVTPLRTATAADAGAVAALINAAFKVERFFIEGDRTNEDEVQAYMAKGTFLLAEQDGAPVGCVYVEERGDRGYFGLLAVHPARHGRGLGRSLIEAAEERFRRAGCRAVDIQVVDLRIELAPFYRRLGYVETGTAPFPAEGRATRPCHFIRMSKPLTADASRD